MPDEVKKAKKKMDRARMKVILRDAGEIIWGSRRRLLIGVPLLLVNRLSSIVLPGTTKYVIDDAIGKGRLDLLWKLAAIAALAAALGSITDYALAQILGMAAQRSITNLRMKIQQHVQRLPVRYFDSTKTGVLVSRVMNDAEGIRNLVGSGLVEVVGGMITAVFALGFLFHFNTKLTLIALSVLSLFAFVMQYAFRTLRPLFRERSKINAEISGRLTESFSGVRVVKAYQAERREALRVSAVLAVPAMVPINRPFLPTRATVHLPAPRR